MRDGANFGLLHDSFMSHDSEFLKGIFNSLSPHPKPLHKHVAQNIHYIAPLHPSTLEVLLLQPSSRTRDAISCLSSAGRYILSGATNGLSCRLLRAILWGVLCYDTPTGYPFTSVWCVCVCVWPPVSGELLSSMRFLSLVLTYMTSLHTLRLSSTPNPY